MDVFRVREQLVGDYREFTSSFVEPREERVREHLARLAASGYQWPAPFLSLNPSFASGGTAAELVAAGLLHPDAESIFRIRAAPDDAVGAPLRLHEHQRQAIETARRGVSYVLTTGTGSGKSLAYIVPIVDRILRARADGSYRPGVKAIIVYPMNALANSQLHELQKFLSWGRPAGSPPVSFARYTGQENAAKRREILADPPDILLTNYVMLELVLTRRPERQRLIAAARGLCFLVLDELHTYRGRQGADVALLVRRTRQACAAPSLQCVGTSATMSSRGELAEQRADVAQVASRLFGVPVAADDVIGESLRRATNLPAGGGAALAARVHAWRTAAEPAPTFEEFVTDPLAGWVESAFGVEVDRTTGGLVRRRRPNTVPAAAGNLAELTGLPEADCALAVEGVLAAGAALLDPATRRPVFAFRLHQFLSKGDNVYVTLEPPATRHITSRYQAVAPGSTDIDRKVLVPLAFCRECGQEYLIVRRLAGGFEPGEGFEGEPGYLYVSDDLPWPADLAEVINDARLPYSGTISADGQSVVSPEKEKYLPQLVQVSVSGMEATSRAGLTAAWVQAPFRFCLRCRVSYERTRGKDFAQLAKLSAEGRSSAVSVISSSVVRALRELPELDDTARKLLAFVDNRQDASLQAGHFNDFVQVVQMRGALYRAAAAEPSGLAHEVVAQRVTEALGLDLAQFARTPEARYGRDEIWRALREVVNYRLYLDLERGWRVTMPNLEQTGLLQIEYRYLDEIAADQELWTGRHPLLADATAQRRQEVLATLLDELRRNLAIDVRCLTEDGFDELRRMSAQHLAEPWRLSDRERAVTAAVAFGSPRRPGLRFTALHLSGRSAMGKYLRQYFGRTNCSVDDAQQVITGMLAGLAEAGTLVEVPARDGAPTGYRLRSDRLLWRAGAGVAGAEDRVRKALAPAASARVNTFFRDLYRDTAGKLAGLHAKEHTAQVAPDLREEREESFRDGDLPLLYCSPTMELGVDINALNAVAMRNVPPTPANYAQRAGRAGRSGQPALVVTYCATGNAHDQYYFQRREQMVGGAVQPPRLDLTNEDLVRSHVHAIWLAATGAELPSSLAALLETGGDHPSLALKAEHARAIGADVAAAATASARQTLGGDGELAKASWWRPTWIDDAVAQAPRHFEAALDRWRRLYQAARKEYEVQGRRAVDTNVSARDRDEAKRRADDARIQLDLLANEDSDEPRTDFYTYRYLASEGFLPGYSFPRLPLAAYIPGLRTGARQGDYIHRPRFIGISEFGPGALIYHEGASYQVRGVQLQQATTPGQEGVLTSASRRCRDCGHLHDDTAGMDECEHCGTPLGATDSNMLRLYTVRTVRRERISSDEEERRRAGFEIETSYRFSRHGSRPGAVLAEVLHPEGPLATLAYGDAATVRRANLGLSRRKDGNIRGFYLNTSTGEWLSESKAAEASAEDDLGDAEQVLNKQRVIPYVQDRRNILILRLARPLRRDAAISLLYALERGIEATFQLEDAELTAEPLPDPDNRGRMLFIESAEGGAGVLRRLVAEPDKLAEVARAALEIAHYDPDTGEDVQQVLDGVDRCVQGCYDCLLSYSNQGFHKVINRELAVDLLLDLARADVVSQETPAVTVDAPGPVGQFLDWLRTGGWRGPDAIGEGVAGTTPDLLYRQARVAVLIDAADEPAGPGRDADAEDALYDAGWSPVRVPAGQWAEAVAKYPSVFGGEQESV